MKTIHYSDHLEQKVGEALNKAGIKFIHDSQSNQRLDFFLIQYDIYIEIKQYHSDRITEQMAMYDNIIVLQGKNSVSLFVKFIEAFGDVKKLIN